MLTSYHVHSTFSDGTADIRALVEGANRLGIDQLGISDHYTVMPDGSVCPWSMPLEEIPEYLNAIDDAASLAADGLSIKKGLEADFFPETVDTLAELVTPHNLDYIIGSIHFVDGFPIDESAEHWERLSIPERNAVVRGYWTRVAQMASSHIYSFAAHLDLHKKYNYQPTVDISDVINTALDAIASAGMAVEVSTAGLHFPVKEVYPSPDIIKMCRSRKIPVVITADAHTPENLARDYDTAREILRTSGYSPTDLWHVR